MGYTRWFMATRAISPRGCGNSNTTLDCSSFIKAACVTRHCDPAPHAAETGVLSRSALRQKVTEVILYVARQHSRTRASHRKLLLGEQQYLCAEPACGSP